MVAMATIFFFNIGADQLLHDHPDIIDMSVVEDTSEPLCHKDTGKTKKLRRWSRGHQFIVRGGGHIETWQPLFK